MPVHFVLAFVKSRAPAIVPNTIPSIINQSRDISATKLGPVTNCQTFVTKEGRSSREAAVTGGMKALRTPIETVGKPIPVTPLTIPARTKVNAIGVTLAHKRLDIPHYLLVTSMLRFRQNRWLNEISDWHIERALNNHPSSRSFEKALSWKIRRAHSS
jgi:hypothetical protein